MNRKSIWIGIITGVIYGLFVRAVAQIPSIRDQFSVMSVAFLFFAPLAVGAVTITDENISRWKAFFSPMIAVLLGCAGTAALNWEGKICVVFYLPAGLILAGIGGLLGRYLRRRKQKTAALALLVLPFLAPIESHLPVASTIHEVHSETVIPTTKSAVWNQIKSVRTITRDELPDSWVHKIGFPRPLDAEIDREAVGGIRNARFEGQLTFHETVTDWRPEEELSFDIAVDPKSIPPTTLDEHVTIGGPFFDVLHGSYQIEDAGPGLVRLKLTSRFRISTHFNPYAEMWTTLVMDRIQEDILSVIKKRSI